MHSISWDWGGLSGEDRGSLAEPTLGIPTINRRQIDMVLSHLRLLRLMKAQILKPTAENYQFCAKVLHDHGLVAFPTGTASWCSAHR